MRALLRPSFVGGSNGDEGVCGRDSTGLGAGEVGFEGSGTPGAVGRSSPPEAGGRGSGIFGVDGACLAAGTRCDEGTPPGPPRGSASWTGGDRCGTVGTASPAGRNGLRGVSGL
jgi:hypothetical protein